MPRGPQASVPAPFSILGIHHTTICAFCQSGSLNIPHKQNLSRYQRRLSSNGIDGDLNDDNEGRETHTLQNPDVTRLQEAYVRKVVDTLNDLDNVLWEISNESHTDSIRWHYHMIRFIRQYEASLPKQHPIGMTSSPISNPPLFAGNADWISPNGKDYLTDPPDTAGRKVIIVDNDHIRPWDSDPSWVWKNLMRGNQFILMDHYMDFRMGAPDRPDPKHDPTRRAMGFARALAERVDLAAFEPQSELSSTKYCLARPGKEYLAYQPNAKGGEIHAEDRTGDISPQMDSVHHERLLEGETRRSERGRMDSANPAVAGRGGGAP